MSENILTLNKLTHLFVFSPVVIVTLHPKEKMKETLISTNERPGSITIDQSQAWKLTPS